MNAAQRATFIREQSIGHANALAELFAEIRAQAANEVAGKPFTTRQMMTLYKRLEKPQESPGGREPA